MARYLLRSSFFSTIRLLASSDAMAYYRPVLERTDGIPERDQRPRDNGYKSIFTNSWLVRQRHRSWIKGLGKKSNKRVSSFIAGSAFCLGPLNCDPMDSETQLRVYKSDATMARHTYRNQNVCLKVLRLSMGKICACIHGLRRELVNPFASGIQKVLLSHITGLFSVKAIKNFSVNDTMSGQPNKRLIH